jgi:tmRNA-binding protein
MAFGRGRGHNQPTMPVRVNHPSKHASSLRTPNAPVPLNIERLRRERAEVTEAAAEEQRKAARKVTELQREIERLKAKIKEKGYTLVPLRLFFNERNFLKLEIGLARGKKLHDKRETIKRREQDRELRRDGGQ